MDGTEMMFLSRHQVRELDRRAIEEFGVPGVVLMENAGRGVAELMVRLGIRGPVIICCGKGNNGGDGFVIARHLDIHQVPVRIHLFGRAAELTGDAAVMHDIVARTKLPLSIHAGPQVGADELRREFDSADWIVDALFGTGLSGPVRPPFDRVIEMMNESHARMLAVDIPSGLDCDTGLPLGTTVKATCTATFVAMKKGFANAASQQWVGQVHVVGIGAPRQLVESYGEES
jgi:NAD(P)H-hydrate epimerase